ncbi:MAG: GLUG motif-containing protein [Candidatus Saccharimonadales bacterium]
MTGIAVFYPYVSEAFSGSGDGTSESPYEITSCEQLQSINDDKTAHYILANDIDCSDTVNWNSGAGFVPIGGSSKFSGSFDGDNYTISNLYIDYSGTYTGLFGHTGDGASIENVNMVNADVTGASYTGVLVGRASTTTTIDNAHIGGSLTASGSNVGGIVGYLYNSHIYNSSSSVDASGSGTVGSAVGTMQSNSNTGSIIDNTYATGDVRVDSSYGGGFIGSKTYGTISNSYATGSVLGDQSGGTTNTHSAGFVGNFCYGKITGSYATGDVYGADDLGGFFARSHNCNSNDGISDSYARGDIYPSAGAGGAFGDYIYLGSVVRSYATGTVNGGQTNGGFIYWAHTCNSCSDNFWDLESTGQSTGGALNSGSPTGKTTAEMKDIATFTDTSTTGLSNSWDFAGNPNDDASNEDIWIIDESINDGYPYLAWQVTNLTPNNPTGIGPSGAINGSWTATAQPTLTFNVSDDDSDQVSYQIQIANSADFNSLIVDYTSALQDGGSAQFTVGQVASGGSYTQGSVGQELVDGDYFWRVRVIDEHDAESEFVSAPIDEVAFRLDATGPTTPGKPVVSASTNQKPTWSWSESDDVGAGLSSPAYSVEWSQSSVFTGTILSGTASTTSYSHSSALGEGTWYFRVRATDLLSNHSAYSAVSSITITVPDKDSPTTSSDSTTNNESQSTLAVSAEDDTDSEQDDSPKIILNDYEEFEGQGKLTLLATKQVVYFMVDDEEHSITVDLIRDEFVVTTIASEPQTDTIYVGGSKQYDVNGDGEDDIEITLNEVVDGSANLVFRSLSSVDLQRSPVATQSENDTSSDTGLALLERFSLTVWLYALIATASLLLAVYIIRRKLKNSKVN